MLNPVEFHGIESVWETKDFDGKVVDCATFLLGTAPTFAKDFRNTHARVRPPTRCSVMVALRSVIIDRPTTRFRGTPMDTSDFRGTRFSITHIVTSTGEGGVKFWRGEKSGGD